MDLVEELARAICGPGADQLEEETGSPAWVAFIEDAKSILARLDALGLVVVPKPPKRDAMAESIAKQIEGGSDGPEWSHK